MSEDTGIDQKTFQSGGVATIAGSHAINDTYTAFLPALLPVLIEKFSLTNSLAGLLSVFLQLPSLLQPIIGHLADSVNLRLVVVLAPAVTGAGMSLLSIAPSYGFLIFLLLIAGLSSASLHAIGPVMGGTISGNKLGRGMSFWMVGGELGRTIGPLVVVSAIGYLTLEGLPWLMLAGIFTSLYLYGKIKINTTRHVEGKPKANWKSGLRQIKGIMLPVAILVLVKSLMAAMITTFLPTFLTEEGSSLWVAGASLSILEAAGVAGAFLAGSMSDRFGRQRMLLIGYTATPFFMLLFFFSKGILQVPLLILMGFFGLSVNPVLMALVLENCPENRSLANGIFMLYNFIFLAVGTMIVGWLGDLISLRFTFIISAGLILVGLPVIHFLPCSGCDKSESAG